MGQTSYLLQRANTDYGAHQTSVSNGVGGSLSSGKVAGAWNRLLIPSSVKIQNIWTHSSIPPYYIKEKGRHILTSTCNSMIKGRPNTISVILIYGLDQKPGIWKGRFLITPKIKRPLSHSVLIASSFMDSRPCRFWMLQNFVHLMFQNLQATIKWLMAPHTHTHKHTQTRGILRHRPSVHITVELVLLQGNMRETTTVFSKGCGVTFMSLPNVGITSDSASTFRLISLGTSPWAPFF